VIGALDSLLTAAAVEQVTGQAYAPNRLLVAQGMATVASSAFAGLPTVYGGAIVIGNYRAGGRTRLSAIPASLLLLCLLVFGSTLLGLVPHAVSAGVMVCVALVLFDRWTSRVTRRAFARGGIPELRYSLAIVVIVCVVTVLLGFVVSLVVGLCLAMILFVTGLNRSLVRGIASGSTRSSRRIYPPEQASVLRAQGEGIKLVTLEGAIFFGTAETLRREVTQLAANARHVILDLRRVTAIDASGALVIGRAEGLGLVLAGSDKASALGLALAGARIDEVPAAGAEGRKRTVFFVDREAAAEVPENLIAPSYYWTAADERPE
jgi:MFS superfamily sulfate permease-like transporter